MCSFAGIDGILKRRGLRLMSRSGDPVLIPTAIGWFRREKPLLGAVQHNAWETDAGHAVANGCFVAAVNRASKGRRNSGASFVADPCECARAGQPFGEEILSVTCDLQAVEEFRRIWPSSATAALIPIATSPSGISTASLRHQADPESSS